MLKKIIFSSNPSKLLLHLLQKELYDDTNSNLIILNTFLEKNYFKYFFAEITS